MLILFLRLFLWRIYRFYGGISKQCFWQCFAWILRYFNANKWREYGFCTKEDFAKEVYFGD